MKYKITNTVVNLLMQINYSFHFMKFGHVISLFFHENVGLLGLSCNNTYVFETGLLVLCSYTDVY